MKKVIYISFCLLIIIILPSICTRKRQVFNNNSVNKMDEVKIMENNYTYEKFSTIKLLHSNDLTIEELPIDQYLIRSCLC